MPSLSGRHRSAGVAAPNADQEVMRNYGRSATPRAMPSSMARSLPKGHFSGFQSWGEIELDDGQWEIDDAQRKDGKKYEMKLNLETLQVEKQKEH
jgi:hypothetical protein